MNRLLLPLVILALAPGAAGAAVIESFNDRAAYNARLAAIAIETFTSATGQAIAEGVATRTPDGAASGSGGFAVLYTTAGDIDDPENQFLATDIFRLQVDIDGPDRTTGFSFLFDSEVDAFGADFTRVNNTADANELVFSLYNNDALVGSASISLILRNGNPVGMGPASVDGFAGFTSDMAFDEIRLSSNVTDSFDIDNASLGTLSAAAVPLPAGGALLMSGLLGLAALRRRR